MIRFAYIIKPPQFLNRVIVGVMKYFRMMEFEYTSELKVGAEILRRDAFTMEGVNFELFPLIKMTSPKTHTSKSILEWPKNERVFTSVLLLLGFIPVDCHSFNFIGLEHDGFEEHSSTFMNKIWNHKRTIIDAGNRSLVVDKVSYQSRTPLIGSLMKPLYKFIFEHRHNRLRSKY